MRQNARIVLLLLLLPLPLLLVLYERAAVFGSVSERCSLLFLPKEEELLLFHCARISLSQ